MNIIMIWDFVYIVYIIVAKYEASKMILVVCLMFPVRHWIWILYVWIKRVMSPHSVLHEYIRPYRIEMFVAFKMKAPIAKQTLPIHVCEILKAPIVKFWSLNQPTAFFLEGSVVNTLKSFNFLVYNFFPLMMFFVLNIMWNLNIVWVTSAL